MPSTPSGANSYTGPTFIDGNGAASQNQNPNQPNVSSVNTSQLGNGNIAIQTAANPSAGPNSVFGNGTVTFTSGILNNATGNPNYALPNPINFNNSYVQFGATNRLYFHRPRST